MFDVWGFYSRRCLQSAFSVLSVASFIFIFFTVCQYTTMDSATTRNSKRRRVVSSAQSLHITDLPDGIFADVAKYLAKPSIACFAVAMTPSESRLLSNNAQMGQSSLCKAILNSQEGDSWEELDFGDIEKSLAAKLSDDDVRSILMHIDAVNNLNKLKLTGCVNITGEGLSPLGGSVVLKEIDLSLVGQHQSPDISPEPKISEEVVLPILNSIVSAEGTLIEFIRLPKVWRERRIPQMDQFIESFNRLETSRNHKCTLCNVICREKGHGLGDGIYDVHDPLYGSQNFSCNICRRFFCYLCETEEEVGCLKNCGRCEGDYCSGCNPMIYCDHCNDQTCSKCGTLESCTNCGDRFCDDCADKCDCRNETRCKGCAPGYRKCEYDGCKRVACDDCPEAKQYGLECCDTCDETYCSECRYLKCSKDLANSCPECLKMIAVKMIPKLVEEKKIIPELREEISGLREENTQLRKEIEELRNKLHTQSDGFSRISSIDKF